MLDQMKTGLAERKGELLLMSLLVAAEVFVFWPSFNGFFFGDSLHVIRDRPRVFRDLLLSFIDINAVGFYRPISQSLTAYLLIPLFKTHFTGYHAFSLVIHSINSILAFIFLKRFYGENVLAFVGASFFALHPTNFYATYDSAFYPDILYFLFYVSGLLALINYAKSKQKRWYIVTLILYVLSLMSKEAAVTFPVLVFLYLLLFEKGIWRSLRLSIPFVIILLIYLACYIPKFNMVNGKIIPKIATGHEFYFGINIFKNFLRFFYWAFGASKGWATAGWDLKLLQVDYLMASLVVIVCIYGLFRKEPKTIFGGLFFLLVLVPVSPIIMILPHHIYLALLGLSLLIAGLFAVFKQLLSNRRLLLAFYLLVALFFYYNFSAARKSVLSDLEHSWVGYSSQVARNAAEFLKNNESKFYNATSIYIVGEPHDATWYHLLSGELFRFLTGVESLNIRVLPDLSQVPSNLLESMYVFKCANMRLYDITSEYRKLDEKEFALQDHNRTYDLIEAFIKGRSELITSETDFSDTGGKPVFLIDINRQEKRNALITLPGRKVRFPLIITDGSCLEFGIALMYDTVDGAEAQVLFEKEGQSEVLFFEHVHPLKRASDRRWHDYSIDLSRFKGERGYLSFQCLPGPMGDATGDWLGWSKMIIKSK